MTVFEEFDYRVSPLECMEHVRGWGRALFLDSSRRHHTLGRYSYLAAEPAATLSWRDGPARLAFASDAFRPRELELDPLRVARLLLPNDSGAAIPWPGGWCGYIGYEYGAALHSIHLGVEVPAAPLFWLGWYSWALVWDHLDGRAFLAVLEEVPDESAALSMLSEAEPAAARTGGLRPRRPDRTLLKLRRVIASAARQSEEERQKPQRRSRTGTAAEVAGASARQPLRAPASNFTRAEYEGAVRRVREYIAAGDIFQANIAQQFTHPFAGDPWKLYLQLRETTPATHAAYIEADGATVLSASPELFLTVWRDGSVETRPIKGTRSIDPAPGGRERTAEALRASEKDVAENLMIVDLMRNDLSRVCDPGSVRVAEFCTVEEWASVLQMVSSVKGHLAPGFTVMDLLSATLPGGSITGAPKERAMQIIAELEGAVRGVYCGCVGYMSAPRIAQFNIAIRTITCYGESAVFGAGAGITLSSDPASEYEETLAKGAGLAAALAG